MAGCEDGRHGKPQEAARGRIGNRASLAVPKDRDRAARKRSSEPVSPAVGRGFRDWKPRGF